MKNKFKRSVAIMSAILTVCTGCKSTDKNVSKDFDLTSYPVKADVELTLYRELPVNISSSVSNFGDTPVAKELEKRTGVKVKYIHPAAGQARETLNLMISSNDLPDMVENNWLSGYAGGPERAINDNIITSIGEYKQYAPAMFKYFADNPNFDKASKTDSGDYYMFPSIMPTNSLRLAIGPAVRTDWLNELGLSYPETVDEWEVMLQAFKDKKNAEAPFSFNYSMLTYAMNMMGAVYDFYVDNGEMKFGPAQPEFKTALTILNDWYNKGLLDKNIVSVDKKLIDSQVLTGKTGATITSGGAGIGQYMKAGRLQNPNFDMSGVVYPTFKKGEVNDCTYLSSNVTGRGIAISKKCKYPEVAAKFLDYGFTDEGHMFYCFGEEGVSYTMENGYPKYTDLIMNNSDGLTMSQAMGLNIIVGNSGGMPFYSDERYLEQYYNLPQQKTALDNWLKGVDKASERSAPLVTPTADETTESAQLMSEVNKYADQMIVKFITGVEPISKFDDYVKKLNEYGLPRVLKIQNKALDRYNKR